MRIAVVVCAVFGFLSLCYYLAIVLYAGIAADFSWFWLALALLLAGIAFLVNYERSHPGFSPAGCAKRPWRS